MKPWHIFPVGRRSKDPLVADPFLFASNDKAQIDLWSTKYPGCNSGRRAASVGPARARCRLQE